MAGLAVRFGLVWVLSSGGIAWAQQTDAALAAASSLVRTGQYDAAIATAQQALRTHPADARLQTVEGIAYSMKGDDTEALAALQAALRARPNYLGALKAEAEILVRKGDPAAIPVLRQILKADPQDGTAHEMLGMAEAQAGKCPAAITDFEAAGAPLQSHTGSLERLGACLFEANAYARAVPVFQQLLSLRPEDSNARYDLALAQMRAGQSKAAGETLAPSLEHTSDIDLLLLASDVAEDNGDTPQAAALLRRAIVADPQRASSYVRFAELCMLHESYQPGVDMVSAGVQRMPDNASLYLARGMLYGGMASYDKAEADFQKAEDLDPHHGSGAYGVGLVEVQNNQSEEALSTVRAGLRVHPEDPQLHFLLGRILVDKDPQPNTPVFAEAKRSAELAVRKDPTFVPAHDLLAKIYMLAGENALAVAQCKAALALDPSDQNALYRLMRSTREMGDDATAQQLAKQVAEMHQRARESESSRLRYRIEEGKASEPVPAGAPAPTPQP